MSPVSPDVPNLRTLLLREHTELNETFAALLVAVQADARVECAELWSEFDTRLHAHMQLEEELILPAFEREHPEQAARIRAEHATIRSTLLELGIGVDLHFARADVIERFVALLRAHAGGEDRELYAWSQEHLAPETQSSVLDRLLGRLRRMPASIE